MCLTNFSLKHKWLFIEVIANLIYYFTCSMKSIMSAIHYSRFPIDKLYHLCALCNIALFGYARLFRRMLYKGLIWCLNFAQRIQIIWLANNHSNLVSSRFQNYMMFRPSAERQDLTLQRSELNSRLKIQIFP